MTKKEKVRQHLLKYGSITSWEAIMKYNATRLSEEKRRRRNNHLWRIQN